MNKQYQSYIKYTYKKRIDFLIKQIYEYCVFCESAVFFRLLQYGILFSKNVWPGIQISSSNIDHKKRLV